MQHVKKDEVLPHAPAKKLKLSASTSKSDMMAMLTNPHYKEIALEMKQDRVHRHEAGDGPSKTGRSLNLALSAMSTILMKAKAIKTLGETITPKIVLHVPHTHSPVMAEMAKLFWIKSQNHKKIPLSTAETLWEDLCQSIPDKEHGNFQASSGRF